MPARLPKNGFPARSARSLLCVCCLAVSLAACAMKPPGPQAGDAAHPPRPGYLGVSLRDLDAAEATRLNLLPASGALGRTAAGALIVTVDRDAPAWSSGLRPGDVVLELNAQQVDGVEDLRRRLRECPVGDTITLRVRRRGEERSFAVPLGDRDAVAREAVSRHLHGPEERAGEHSGEPPLPSSFSATDPAPPLFSSAPAIDASPGRGVASTLFDALTPGAGYTGLECSTLSPQLAGFFGVRSKTGLLVTGVNPGSPAADAGLTAGDVILRAAEKPVNTRGALAHALRTGKGNAVALTVMRDHKEMFLSLQPGRRKKL